ncbi:MAG: hypothetical protein ABI207_07775 [Crocinitomicaceae bacterium]
MTTFEIKQHIEIDEDYQGISLTEFSIMTDKQTENKDIIESFIHSTSFTVDSLREVVKIDTENKPYLQCSFDIDKINIDDFKRKSKDETVEFLYDFLNQPDWGDDKNEFLKLLDKYFEIHNKFGDIDFYIISKDWFNIDDQRLIKPESWVYSYYFLIISIDRNLNLLTLTEWTYE